MPNVSAAILEGRAEGVQSMITAPLLDLRMQYANIRTEIREAIDRVCKTERFILDPEVTALEEEVAKYCTSSTDPISRRRIQGTLRGHHGR
jgi:hypothetical protein